MTCCTDRWGDSSSSGTGDTSVTVDSPTTGTGELITAALAPAVQITAENGIVADDVEIFASLGGTVVESESKYLVSTAVGIGSFAALRSKRTVRYRPRESSEARVTARFDTANAVANGLQAAGVYSAANDFFFGYDGTSFGIRWSRFGALEIQALTLTVGAAGAESATITLDGASTVVPITAGTVQRNAWEISRASFPGWNARAVDDTVIFVAQDAGDKTGAFSYTSSGASAGTLAETTPGAALETTWYPQATWNRDPLNKDGASGIDLVPSNLNAYRIQWNEAGAVQFYVEDPTTGKPVLCHVIEHLNTDVRPVVSDANLHVGWVAATLGAPGGAFTVEGTSASGFVQGADRVTRNPRGLPPNTITGVTTALTSILTLRNGNTYNGRISQRTLIPLLVDVAVDGTKPAEVQVLLNTQLSGFPVFEYVDEGNSIVEVDRTGTAITDGIALPGGVVAKDGRAVIDLTALAVTLERGDSITVAVRATSGTTDATASITWRED